MMFFELVKGWDRYFCPIPKSKWIWFGVTYPLIWDIVSGIKIPVPHFDQFKKHHFGSTDMCLDKMPDTLRNSPWKEPGIEETSQTYHNNSSRCCFVLKVSGGGCCWPGPLSPWIQPPPLLCKKSQERRWLLLELLLWTRPTTTAASGNSNSVYETLSAAAAVAKTAAAAAKILDLCTSFKMT